jgi:selenocysteine lyase/cysteine desulfurase
VLQERKEGKNVKIAMFDTVLTFPGARMLWEDIVAVCRELDVWSLIDGAHGIGLIDLTHLGKVSPDFFVSNYHKHVSTLCFFRLVLNKIGGFTCLADVQSSTFLAATSISYGHHCQHPIPIYSPARNPIQAGSPSSSSSLTL